MPPATEYECYQCGAALEADGTCPFCAKCDALGIHDGGPDERRLRRAAL